MNLESLRMFFKKGDQRTIILKKNIIGSILLKGVSIVVSFLIVPLTINFVDPTQYGIWLTLSSVLSWFYFFDIGLGMGLKNRFAEAKARGEIELAKAYTSTAYAALSIMAATLLLFAFAANYFINWSSVLNLPEAYSSELTKVFAIMISCFSLNFVTSIITNVLLADQRTAFSSVISVIGQVVILAVIWTLTGTVRHGSLITLALILSGIPQAVLIIASILLYSKRYSPYRPSFRAAKFRLVKDILGMGGKFFIITTSMLFIFQIINIVISRELGPEAVTEYNIAYKYFNTAYMIVVLVLNPFWAAFTDAYTTGNFDWMRGKARQLERMWLVLVPILAIMLAVAQPVYHLWIGDSVSVSAAVNISVAVYISILSLANVYMYMLNGIGKVKIQLYIYLAFALIAFPSMSFLCHRFGIPGLLTIPIAVYTIQALTLRIQTYKIINQKACGLWNK